MADTKTMVKFKYGSYEGFKNLGAEGGKGYEAGTLYITIDEQGIYFAKDNENMPIKLGNIITYNSVNEFNENTQPPYSADVFYYITNGNMLFKYNEQLSKFVQLNKDYGNDISDIKLAIENETTGLDALNTKIGDLVSTNTQTDDKITTLTNRVKADEDNLKENYYTKEEINAEIEAIVGGEGSSSLAGLKEHVDSEIERVEGEIATTNSEVAGLKDGIGKLANVMNFVGVAPISDGEIIYENYTQAIEAFYASKGQSEEIGDVVIYDGLEYVYTDAELWEPFGSAAANTAKFEQLTNAVSGLDTRLETAESKIGTLETKTGTLETAVSEHGTKIEAIEGNIAIFDDEIDDVVNDLAQEALNARAAEEALGERITELDEDYKAADAEIKSYINNALAWEPF